MGKEQKLRVGAYCRVSTAKEDQRNSLQNQRQYFEEYIKGEPDWELVEIYADEGISGTSSRNRPAFCRMLAAAQTGEIDLILTKEVSRFARNTVDTLAHTRRLRQLGVGVVFIGDRIDTRQNDGEFRLTIMASIAQEESRKISERVKWGQKRSMEHGVVFGCNNIYGFTLKDGKLTVKPNEAEVIRLVYHKFLWEGKGTHVIARELSERGIKAPRAKEKPWSATMVLRLLRNEKYCGDLRQKKTFTPNYLDHKKQINQGQEEQVYLTAHHEQIISREMFEQVQLRLAQRAASRGRGVGIAGSYWCTGRIFCARCGSTYVHRKRQRKSGEVCHDWVCGTRVRYGLPREDALRGKIGCDMPILAQETIYRAMAQVLEQLGLDKERLAQEVLTLLALDGMDGAALEELYREQRRQERRQEDALAAYIQHRMTRERLQEMNEDCEQALCRIDQQLAERRDAALTAEAVRAAIQIFLVEKALQTEAVYKEVLERMQIERGAILLGLCGLPMTFRLSGWDAPQMRCEFVR